jgi:hypothetical protein
MMINEFAWTIIAVLFSGFVLSVLWAIGICVSDYFFGDE